MWNLTHRKRVNDFAYDETSYIYLVPLVVVLFIGTTVYCQNFTVQWEFNAGDVYLEKSTPYTRVFLIDAMLPEDMPGTPWLPAKYVNVLIPPDVVLTDVNVEALEEVCIASDVLVYPVQNPQPVSGQTVPFMRPNLAVYSSEERLPVTYGSVQGTHPLHGYSLLAIRLNPIRYVPLARELYLATRIAAKIIYEKTEMSNASITQNLMLVNK